MNMNIILDIALVVLTTYVMYELVIKKKITKQEREVQEVISVEEEVMLTPEQLKEAKEQTLFRLFSTFKVNDYSQNEVEKILNEKVKEKPLNRQILIDSASKVSYEEQIRNLSKMYQLYKENLKKGLRPDSAFEKVIND